MENQILTRTAGGGASPPVVWRDRKGGIYEPAIGPRLRLLLAAIFASVALLGATGIYLLAIHVVGLVQDQVLESPFSLGMILVHILLGVAIVVPFLFFGVSHLTTARHRPNRRAVRLGIVLFITSILVGLTGIVLIRLDGLPQLPVGTLSHQIVLWLHIVTPVAAVVVYALHRRAGPDIRWSWGISWGAGVGVFTLVMLYMHSLDPRQWYAKGLGEEYFEPSRARTVGAKRIPERALMMDEYCLKCHADIYNSHIHSAHRFSSFNNPAYLFSVKETRARMGTRASRWCAGCHDPVPFFTGQFDDDDYDMVNHPTAKVGITCTVCHAMTHVNSRSGNADYTIEEPIHYPFAYSDNPILQWLNNQLVKSKPDFHKKTFLKPFHRSENFCSTCHKVGIPQEVNHYKEFLRGQDHPTSAWLSAAFGHGARSFYYPPISKNRCANCHMPLVSSNDFGSKDFDGTGERKIHSHFFPGANTGVAAIVKYAGYEKAIEAHKKFLTEGLDGKSPALRLDLFGLKQLHIDAPLMNDQPLRPALPTLQPGGSYLVEVVIRTLNMGHHFTQGTADSNEVWLEFTAKSGGRTIGRSGFTRRPYASTLAGGEGDDGPVDPWAHFFNVFMLDRHGNRIDRRNPQDIFTPLYDHQIPPGAAQVVHYRLRVPPDVTEPVELTARVRYRKFDYTYMEKVFGPGKAPKLPIVDVCSDRVVLPVAGGKPVPAQTSPIRAWERWNDYGIGCFLEGGPEGKNGGELAQAERSFQRLLSSEFRDVKEAHGHGHVNLARVHLAYGGQERLNQARQALIDARQAEPPAPWWTVAWFNGVVNLQNANLDQAIENFRQILDPANRDPKRNHDFTGDYIVRNELGKALFYRGQQEEREKPKLAKEFFRQAIQQFQQTLELNAEEPVAHDFLGRCYGRLAENFEAQPPVPGGLREQEQRLHDLALELSRPDQSLERRREHAKHLARALTAHTIDLRMAVLVDIRRSCRTASSSTSDIGLRLLVAQALAQLDRHILAQVPDMGARLADARSHQELAEASAELSAALLQLANRPGPINAQPLLGFSSRWPVPGSPVHFALEGLAVGGYLQGPLPPPRILTLQGLTQKVQPLFQSGDAQARAAAAAALARVHQIYHGIYKPDENAQGQAVGLARQRYPAANRASHAIVIYDTRPQLRSHVDAPGEK